MNFQKFFELAKAKGLQQSQIQVNRSKATDISLFHKEIEHYTIADTQSITACGIYKGKFGSARTQKLDKDSFAYLIDQIILTATYNEKEGEAELFKGSEKYHKKNVYNPELAAMKIDDKIALLHKIEDGLLAYDKRISEVETVAYSESEGTSEFYNSFGLKLRQKSNHCFLYAAAVAKQNEETKTYGDVYFGDGLKAFDPEDFVKKIASQAIAKFGGIQCPSKKYPTVLRSDVMSSLVNYFLDSASSEEVQKQSSFLIGKLGQKVASSHVSIEEKPLAKNVFFTYFDDEGVATFNKPVLKRGILQNYFYNRETGKKAGVMTTGNGYWVGPKIGVGYVNVFVKPGKKSFAEMISPIKEGVYITDVAGLGTGMNAQSGDFSCQAEGYMIKDGKLAEPLSLITLSGNLLTMMKGIKEFDKETKLFSDSITVSDAYVRAMNVGGK